jgi:hypothetical protein
MKSSSSWHKKEEKMLTLQFISYSQIAGLSPGERIKMLLDIVMQQKIVLLEGRLSVEEEKELLKINMEKVDETFTGIEFEVIRPETRNTYMKLRRMLAEFLLGKREGFTIIGPANVVKEIRKDPDKIQLFTKDFESKKKKAKKK